MEKFQNKYRIASARLRSWDYANNGMYFITICTKNREHFFGEINKDEMFLNDIGKIANYCWAQIPGHFKFVELGEFVIMPNHVHGIIIIDKPDDGDVVGTGHALSLQSHHPRFRNQGKNTVSAMVGSFKSATTKLAHPVKKSFEWQTRFYDHIIRNEISYQRISRYILNNPASWKEDKFL